MVAIPLVLPRLSSLVFFWVLGPPMVLQTVVLESVSIAEAMRRTSARLQKRGGDTFFAAVMVTIALSFLRDETYRLIDAAVEAAGGREEMPGLLLDALLRAAVSGATLAYVSAWWIVAYINAKSLTEGSDSGDLKAQTRWLESRWQT